MSRHIYVRIGSWGRWLESGPRIKRCRCGKARQCGPAKLIANGWTRLQGGWICDYCTNSALEAWINK